MLTNIIDEMVDKSKTSKIEKDRPDQSPQRRQRERLDFLVHPQYKRPNPRGLEAKQLS